jgi:hypothetical protein
VNIITLLRQGRKELINYDMKTNTLIRLAQLNGFIKFKSDYLLYELEIFIRVNNRLLKQKLKINKIPFNDIEFVDSEVNYVIDLLINKSHHETRMGRGV